jgi:hypothetical protein
MKLDTTFYGNTVKYETLGVLTVSNSLESQF